VSVSLSLALESPESIKAVCELFQSQGLCFSVLKGVTAKPRNLKNGLRGRVPVLRTTLTVFTFASEADLTAARMML